VLDHQVVLLVPGRVRISNAVLTMRDVSHAYGKDTLKGTSRACCAACRPGSSPAGPGPSRGHTRSTITLGSQYGA
jgi:hypothetical protein